jgi:hypothetical protein
MQHEYDLERRSESPPPTDLKKLRFGRKAESPTFKADAVLTGASASLPGMQIYPEKVFILMESHPISC